MKKYIFTLLFIITMQSQANEIDFSNFGGLKATIYLKEPTEVHTVFAATVSLCIQRIQNFIENIPENRIAHIGECIINHNESSGGGSATSEYSVVLKNSPAVCLSCPLLNDKTFGIFYPKNTLEIEQLYLDYKIDMYNLELTALQKKYDLKGFEIDAWNLKENNKNK